MTDNEIRIAIAECGWNNLEPYKYHDAVGITGIRPAQSQPEELPDYPNDLNSMHEAWKTLNDNQKQKFDYALIKVVCPHSDPVKPLYIECCSAINATARQRAEAFLRTIGKWKD